MHIGVVEDNPQLRAMVETYRNAPSFLSAFQRAGRTPPYDLVIIDLFLDRQSGTDVVEALRVAHPRAIPAILISAAAESTLAPLRKRYPHMPILQKPFKVQELISLIKEITSSI